MSEGLRYPKRLIEVDLPIKRISTHARREKSIRHGHISTLHIWWARRPLAACRAVICATLWPDPGDDLCPEGFRIVAQSEMREWAATHISLLGEESYERFNAYVKNPRKLDDLVELRHALLDFIADFANWDNSSNPQFIATSRALTQAAHEALGGVPGTRPLVVDPFAGGGAIPLEALRVGADTFASDFNPVPVLLNKVVLEYIPKYGQRLADAVRTWGAWIKQEAVKELAEFYPRDTDGATPIAYLWARTVRCEGPACGAEVPLVRSLWLAKKANRSVALRLVLQPKVKRVGFGIIVKRRGEWVDQDDPTAKIPAPKFEGTVKGGSATCPHCGFTTQVTRVREQLRARRGGAGDARLMCVVTTRVGQVGRSYRPATPRDEEAAQSAGVALTRMMGVPPVSQAVIPDEPLPPKGTLGFRVQNYGVLHWSDIYTPRQALTLGTISKLVRKAGELSQGRSEPELGSAVQAVLGLSLGRLIGRVNALCWWRPQADQEKVEVAFSGQTVPMKWDFAEGCPLTGGTAGWDDSYAPPVRVIETLASVGLMEGTVTQSDATQHRLPDHAADAFVTDPPYYDAVPYAALSDFFYVWLKRVMPTALASSFAFSVAPKDGECIVDEVSGKDRPYFERCMARAMAEGRRVLSRNGIGVVVFAHKSTSGWESQLQAMIDAGWTVTGSWPIDTEMGTRLRARDSAALASSVHIVCRPRQHPAVSPYKDEVGDWREVLSGLPHRIHDWMPRLAEEGVVGADAIFACLGPALEIFSRYSRVERANGEAVSLREFLEQVWAAVSREALSMIFDDPDTAGLDEDARLTAMWLWTLAASTGASDGNGADDDDGDENDDEGAESMTSAAASGFTLEFDAARKIAQGLGARLEMLEHVVQVKGDKARLLSVAERTKYLFGGSDEAPTAKKTSKKPQRALFEELEEVAEQQGWGEVGTPKAGSTTLDRVHQAMILFGAGRGEAMKRFLVEDGVGRGAQFWKLAQALSALYPTGTDEKRWVDGVLARKKGLGF